MKKGRKDTGKALQSVLIDQQQEDYKCLADNYQLHIYKRRKKN